MGFFENTWPRALLDPTRGCDTYFFEKNDFLIFFFFIRDVPECPFSTPVSYTCARAAHFSIFRFPKMTQNIGNRHLL